MRYAHVLLAVGLVSTCGCGADPLPGGWVDDLVLTAADRRPLPAELTAVSGHAVDFLVGFRSPRAEASSIDDRPVREPSQWRYRAEIVDPSGTVRAAQPSGGPSGELHGFEWHATEHRQLGNGRRSKDVYWESPKSPPDDGRSYLWGHTIVPQEPGRYQLIVRLYPTADPRGGRDLNPEFGRPVDLIAVPLVVTPGEPRPNLEATLDRRRGSPNRGKT